MVTKTAANQEFGGTGLLDKLPNATKVWMSHGDKLTEVPEVSEVESFVCETGPNRELDEGEREGERWGAGDADHPCCTSRF